MEAVAGHDPENRQKNPGEALVKSPAQLFHPLLFDKEPYQTQNERFRKQKQPEYDHPFSDGKRNNRHHPAIGIDGNGKEKPDMPVTEGTAVPCHKINNYRCRK